MFERAIKVVKDWWRLDASDLEATVRIADRYFEPFILLFIVVICFDPINTLSDVRSLWVIVFAYYLFLLQIIHYRLLGGRTSLLAKIDDLKEKELVKE